MESYAAAAADLPAVERNSTNSNLTQALATNGAHHHPPYSEMIIGAIAGLKDKDGSSRQAIAKYIDKVYGASNLPPTHANLLTHHLKRMKNEGQLIMVKHSYMLPTTNTNIDTRSVPFEPQPTMNVQDYTVPNTISTDTFAADKPQVRRKPGRPPKPKHDFGLQLQPPPPKMEPCQPQFEQQHQKEDLQSQTQTQTQTQTHLGQDYSAEPIFASLGLADEGVPPPPLQSAVGKRGRGRPLKNATKPGKPKVNSNTMVNGGGVKRGRPKRIGVPVTVPLSTRTLRERPPKSATPPQYNGGGDTDSRRPISRGRGRGQVPRNKFRSQSFGRPSQDGSGTATIVTDPQQLVAYQELKLKYEHLQSKTKQVVGVVRPYINPDYEAFGALQELEMLTGTDVNVQSEKPPSFV